MSDEREPGYYWVRVERLPDWPWEPAQWHVSEHPRCTGWYVCGDIEPLRDVDLAEIGERLTPPHA